MKRNVLALGVAILLATGCIGCAQDDVARGIIAPAPLWNPGKTDEDLIGIKGTAGEVLRKQGRIDLSATIEMPDKTPIDVWAIKARDAQGKPAPAAIGTVLILHSLGSGRVEFPFFGVGERLAKKGYDVVLPNLRRHGYSGGDFITFGVKEKDDLKRVMDKLIADKVVTDKIYVFGSGLGASVGIQYAAIDPRVQGVVAVAPYKDLRAFARQRNPLMSEADFQKLIDATGKLGSFNPDEASSIEAARKLSCPLLLIHGILDPTVPLEWSQAILEAAKGPKDLHVVGLETPLVIAMPEDWLVGQVDTFVKTGVSATSAQTRPAGR